MMIQQVEYDLNSRCLRFGQFTTGIPLSEFTESATDRAGKVLSFDSSGDPNITQELGVFQGNWAASTAYVLRDIIKDSSNNNVYICTEAHTSSGSQPISSNTDVAKWALLVDAASATTSASAAATSATAAASSATAAASSATSAATSATTATTKATAASTSATAAASSATAAASSATAAASSASSASTAQTAAETAETNAETAETNAETAETNAETAEAAAVTAKTAAETAKTAAETAETNAETAETNAETAETNAASSQSAAATSATAAASSATAAASSATAAAASADAFDDVYLGAKASDPTLDNDGDALTAGDLYFNTTSSVLKSYTGSAWNTIISYSAGSSSALGLIKLEDDAVQTTAASAITTTSSRTYGLQVNSSGQGVVNVPWADTDTNTTYTAGDGLDLSTTEFSVDLKSSGGLAIDSTELKLDLSQDQSWTGSQRATLVVDNDGSFDMNAGQNFKCTPAGGLALTFTNFADGQSGYIILVNSGGHTLTRHSDTIADANFLDTVSAAGTYIISYISDGTDAFLTNSAIMA